MCLCGGDDCDPSKTAVRSYSAAILARILVMNTNYLAQLTSEPLLLPPLQAAGFPVEENILFCLVDIWLEKVSEIWNGSFCVLMALKRLFLKISLFLSWSEIMYQSHAPIL